MNRNAKHSVINLEQDELRKLVTEVKETSATNINDKQVFSAANLWSIQKSMRTAPRVSGKFENHF